MEVFSQKSVSVALDIIEANCTRAYIERYALELGLVTGNLSSKKSICNAILQRLFPANSAFEQRNENLETEKCDIVKDAVNLLSRTNDENLICKFNQKLFFDGFSIIKDEQKGTFSLTRIFPQSVIRDSYNDVKDEISLLLEKFGMQTALGHLKQALENYDNGNWAASNSQLRTFFESLLNDIAVYFGCDPKKKENDKRNFLGQMNPPFLFSSLNEWNNSSQKPQFIQGLISRMHPAGNHPGLSDKDDCCFRIQIILITARLLLHRFDAMRQNKNAG